MRKAKRLWPRSLPGPGHLRPCPEALPENVRVTISINALLRPRVSLQLGRGRLLDLLLKQICARTGRLSVCSMGEVKHVLNSRLSLLASDFRYIRSLGATFPSVGGYQESCPLFAKVPMCFIEFTRLFQFSEQYWRRRSALGRGRGRRWGRRRGFVRDRGRRRCRGCPGRDLIVAGVGAVLAAVRAGRRPVHVGTRSPPWARSWPRYRLRPRIPCLR